MPRYVVERTCRDGLRIPVDNQRAQACLAVVENNATKGVFWVHSYVSQDLNKSFCVYDGPPPKPSATWPARTICRSAASRSRRC